MRRKLKVVGKMDDDFTLVDDIYTKGELEEIESEVASCENIPVSEGKADESVDHVLARINKSIDEYQKQKQKKAAELGVPYQTYVGTVLDQIVVPQN